jgi:hypothetical protein
MLLFINCYRHAILFFKNVAFARNKFECTGYFVLQASMRFENMGGPLSGMRSRWSAKRKPPEYILQSDRVS